MTPREIELLLGGYATDTLTGEERRNLFTAALSNQALFDALADEQALKELLADPAARAHLLSALGEKRESPLAGALAWLRRPSVLALAGAVAAAVILFVAVRPDRLAKPQPAPAEVATRQTVEPQPVAPQPVNPIAVAPTPRKPARPKAAAADSVSEKLKDKESESDAKSPSQGQLEDRLARKEAPPPPPVITLAPAAGSRSVTRSESHGQVKSTAQAPEVIVTAQAPAAAPGGARDQYYAAGPFGAVRSFMNRSSKVAGGGASAAPRATGIRYSILARNPDGSSKEVDPAVPVSIGTQIRIRFEANQEGDLSVLRREQDGSWTVWGKSHARVGEPVYLPADDFITMADAGEFHIAVKFARALPLETLTPTPNLLREQSGTSVYIVNPVRTAAAIDFEFTISTR